MKAPLIAPSLLSADFGRLAEEIKDLEFIGADWLHCDIMDGIFVPNISFGLPVLEAIRRYTKLPLDVHLMIQRPEDYIERFAQAGADLLTFHWEATFHHDRLIQEIHRLGKKAGIAINPATPVEVLIDILPEVDLVCVMSVNPGFGGQRFISYVKQKVQRLSDLRYKVGSRALIEVDGGITPETAVLVPQADVLVAGHSLMHAQDRKAVLRQLKQSHP
ncbi:MAG: ribulose-phosphate 3-epimerase [Bacteroidia bacterium]|nr:ribulose-phosphate 3-epimerase [Bacteroidia bacterium]MCX7652523.1 ribulose-phosphate 3-epimerase [Bacteroidia bacterium]MDW8417506.1 ribulose-phosphate 3-epimerase [Bacteroidia bacterium]